MAEEHEEKRQPHISILNHNRIGDVFIALSPALNGWGIFAIILVVTFLGYYWWKHPSGFNDLVVTSVTTVSGFIQISMWLLVAIAGGFVLNKFLLPFLYGLVELMVKIKHLFRPPPTVLHANDNFMAMVANGQMRVHDHQINEVKNVYNHKGELPAPADLPALPPPPVPTGRQLLLDGTVVKHLMQGLIILGPDDTGTLQPMKIKKFFSTLVSGLPSVGKTTTVFWILGQLCLIGAKFWIVDPHMNFEDEDGNKSLAKELDALADSMVFPPCEGRPAEVFQRVRWMYQQLMKRQQPGYIVRAKDTILGVMDEFNSVAGSIDPKLSVVVHEGRNLNFAQTLALLEREGRKFGIHFILIGHKWARQDIGGDNAVRTNATTYLCHRLNDQRQGDLLLGGGQGKKVLTLTTGSYWITGPTWGGEIAKITTPDISAADIPILQQIKRQGVQVINQANVVEADPGTSPNPFDHMVTSAMSEVMSDTISASSPHGQYGDDTEESGDGINQPGKQRETTTEELSLPSDLQAKMLMVIEMDEEGTKGQNEVISTVWGVDPSTRSGRAAVEELRVIRSYLARQARKKLGV